MADAAVGMAAYGLRPCVEIQFADYIYPAYDQIVSELARLRYRSAGAFSAPVTIRTPCGGGIRGGQTHSQSPEAIFAHVCGIKLVDGIKLRPLDLPRPRNRREGLLEAKKGRLFAMDQKHFTSNRQARLDPFDELSTIGVAGIDIKRMNPRTHFDLVTHDAHTLRTILQNPPECSLRLIPDQQNSCFTPP